MKTKPFMSCLALTGLFPVMALAAAPDQTATNPPPLAATNTVAAAPGPAAPAEAPPPPTAAPNQAGAPPDAAAAPVPAMGTNELRLNFRGVPLEMVLNYLSEAAGYMIVLDVQPRGKVDVWSSQPVSKEEAVDLLNSVLNRNGYAAIRKGRVLTIVNRDEAKTRAIPVKLGSDPKTMPDTDEMVTQIIPVRYVEVTQLIKDLVPLVSPQTGNAMTANESGNSIIITDTQANIRRIAEVIQAIDTGAEDVTVVRVFRLQYADPVEMADLLTSAFPDDTRSGGSQSPVQFGGFRRFFGGGGPFGGGGQSSSSNTQNQRIKKRARVLAVADQRTSSVLVSATRDLMDQIEGVVTELDSNPAKKQTVKVFPLQNADPQEAMQVLQDIFQKSGTQNSRNNANQNSVLQNRSTTQQNQQNNASGMSRGTSQTSRRTTLGQ